jgi:TP901 family phage tail tape measure protein
VADKVVSVKLQASVEGFVSGMRKAKASVDDVTKAASPTKAEAFGKLADKAALAGVGIATAVGVAVKRFADFDAAMSAVQANSGATGAELDSLREAAIELGAASQFSATEAAQGINEMSKAGVEAGDILGGGLKGALDLAAAGQISVASAAETAATAMTQFNLEGNQVPHIADLMANAANKAQGGVGDMAAALGQAGLVAAGMGLSIEETTAGLTAFASAGLTGSDAGTSFKTMLQRLQAPVGDAAQMLKKYNISAYDAQGNFVGLANVAGQLQDRFKDLSPEVRNNAMAVIFGSDAIRASNILYKEGAEGINEWTDEVNEQGAAAKQAAALTDNLKGDVERLGGALDSVFIQTGSGANGSLRSLTQGLTGVAEQIGKIPGPVLLAGGALAALALLGPKGVLAYRNYTAQLDSLGLSMEKIAAKGPRAARGVDIATKAAKGLATAAAVATVAYATFDDEISSLGSNTLAGDLNAGADALDRLNKRFADNAALSGRVDSGVDDLGSTLRSAFDPSVMENIDRGLGTLKGFFGGTDVSNVAIANQRLKELDASLADMASSGNAPKAAQAFAALAAEAERQGVSVEELKRKFPGYTEALAAIANSAPAAAAGQGAMADATDDLQESADDAKKALDDLRSAIEGLGSPLAAQRAAERDFQSAIDDASAAVIENGKTLDINSDKGRANQAALDSLRDTTLENVASTFELTGSTAKATAVMQRGRDAFIKAATAAGMGAKEAGKLATKLGLVPKNVAVQVSQSGAASVESAITRAARDREAIIYVRTVASRTTPGVIGGAVANAVRKADGGEIPGYSPHARADNILVAATAGEFMIRKASADSLGKATLDYLNRHGRLPGYADGGYVASRPAPARLIAPRPIVIDRPSGSTGSQRISGNLTVNGMPAYIEGVLDDLTGQAQGGRTMVGTG